MNIPPKKSWRAVRVVAGASPCAAALALREKRFLASEAPRLPLRDCDRQNACQCKYQHLADRRGEPRRSADSAFGGAAKSVSPERRRPGERRERDR
ncbi:MAG TPA: hypothetical protein VMT49_10050 [Steroidobacteraceae bacterium]|nr:hypothetical protein [Steroidobacteraceae bacterium]